MSCSLYNIVCSLQHTTPTATGSYQLELASDHEVSRARSRSTDTDDSDSGTEEKGNLYIIMS